MVRSSSIAGGAIGAVGPDGRPAGGVGGGVIAAMESERTDELAGMREAGGVGFRPRWRLVAASGLLLIAWPPRDWLPYAVVSLLVAFNLAGFLIMPRLTTLRRARACGLVSLGLLNVYVAANAFSYSYLVESPGGLAFYFL